MKRSQIFDEAQAIFVAYLRNTHPDEIFTPCVRRFLKPLATHGHALYRDRAVWKFQYEAQGAAFA
jgi:hypothetical protein